MDVVSLPNRIKVDRVWCESYYDLPLALRDELEAEKSRKGRRKTASPPSSYDIFSVTICGMTFQALNTPDLIRKIVEGLGCCCIPRNNQVAPKGVYSILVNHNNVDEGLLFFEGSYKTANGQIFEVRDGCIKSSSAVGA